MAFFTPFAGLLHLEPNDDQSIDDYLWYENDAVADAYFRAFVEHQHDGLPAVQPFASAASATASASGGSLSPGEVWWAGITAIDRFGGETIALTASAITPGSTSDPTTAPTVTAGIGGTLQGGTYRYGWTIVSGSGETLLSPYTNVTVPFNGSVSVTVPNAGEDWRLYRSFGGNYFGRVTDVPGSASAIVDDGSLCFACDQPPPDENSTQSNCSITVCRPALPANAVAWRVYLSEFPDLPSPSLWAGASGDTGDIASASACIVFTGEEQLVTGAPPPVNRTIPGASQILASQVLYGGSIYLPSGSVEDALDAIGSALAGVGTNIRASGEASGLTGDVVFDAGNNSIILTQASATNSITITGIQWRAGTTGTFTSGDQTWNSTSGNYFGTTVSRSSQTMLIQASRFNVGTSANNYLGTRDYFMLPNAGSGVVASETFVSGNDYRLKLSLDTAWLAASAVVASAGFASTVASGGIPKRHIGVRVISGNASAAALDESIYASGSSNYTLLIPSGVAIDGEWFYIKNKMANPNKVTVDGDGINVEGGTITLNGGDATRIHYASAFAEWSEL